MEKTADKKNFERINYSLRPAKHIERKMFCETFARLSILDNIENYRYIGMGSAYFTDFSLFHKALGITKLVSIESEDSRIDQQRIKFNRPFSCIEIKFGCTYEVLPRLEWNKWKEKSIVWLDYVDKLSEPMFGDIGTVVSQVIPGSIFLISVNIEMEDDRNIEANPNRLPAKKFRYEKLKENVGSEMIPHKAKKMWLNVEDNKSIIREIIDNSIRSAIKTRNYGNSNSHVFYKQLFNLYYKDSADMLTVGGIIYDSNQKDKINMMFNNLEFVKTGAKCFNIKIPKLTYREIQALDKVLPDSTIRRSGIAKNDGEKIPLSKQDVKNYSNIYRYFPNFAETNL